MLFLSQFLNVLLADSTDNVAGLVDFMVRLGDRPSS